MRKLLLIVVLIPVLGFSQDQFEVYFDFNKDVPNEESLAKLNQWSANHKSAEVTKLLGYCDSVDDNQYNRELAMRRIKTVIGLLEKDTIKISEKAELIPFGKEFKLSKDQDRNRKVAFFYTKREAAVAAVKAGEGLISFSYLSDLVAKEKSELATKIANAQKGDIIRLHSISFHFNSEKIMEESMPILEELQQIMFDNPKLRIAIHGHICCNPNGMDTKLSYRRALVIFKYLEKSGIPVGRLSYKGFGSNDPIYKLPERSESERAANRRVEILIVENK